MIKIKKEHDEEKEREKERKKRRKRKYGQAKLKHAKRGIYSFIFLIDISVSSFIFKVPSWHC